MSLPVRIEDMTIAPQQVSEFRLSLSLSITDVEALWDAAAARAMASIPGATDDDIDDMIGPRQDPNVADCLAMLTGPSAIPGCTLTDFRIEERSNTVADHPTRSRRL